MNRSRRLTFLFVMLAVASLVASSCALSHNGIAQITAPHDGDVLPGNQSVVVRVTIWDLSAAASGAWDQDQYTVTDGLMTLAHVEAEALQRRERQLVFTENDPAPGPHYVQLTARASRADPDFAEAPNPGSYRLYSPWYSSNEVCFWVGPNAPADFCSVRTVAQPVIAVTATASPFPTFAPTAVPVILSVSAFPAPLYYGNTCPALSTVTFRAVLNLPPGAQPDLTQVRAHARVVVGSEQSTSGSFLVPLLPTGTWDTATGGQVYTGTLALTHSYQDASNQFNPVALDGAAGALAWYAEASSHDAAGMNAFNLGRTMDQIVDLSPCPVGNQPRRPTNPGGNGPDSASGCDQYTNQLSCDLAGCSWGSGVCTVSP